MWYNTYYKKIEKNKKSVKGRCLHGCETSHRNCEARTKTQR